MTRAVEVKPGSGEMPDYKSPDSRLVHSLRKGYDNLRCKVTELRAKIKYYQIKTRDIEKSRLHHKEEAKALAMKASLLEKENEKLKAELEKKTK